MPVTVPVGIFMKQSPANVGSICCLARDQDGSQGLYILSAGHVVAPLDAPDPGAVRGSTVCCAFADGTRRDVGRLLDWEVIHFGIAINPFDVGIVEVQPEMAQMLISQVPMPTGVTSLTEEGWDVYAFGTHSGKPIRGRIRERRASSVSLTYYFDRGRIEQAAFNPDNHFATDDISDRGDSGAPAIDAAGRLMGVLVGGSGSGDRSFFARIDPVLTRFGVMPLLFADNPNSPSAEALWNDAVWAPGVSPSAGAPQAPVAAPASGTLAQPASVLAGDPTSVDVLARTLWGEGRGEIREGIVGIACVVLNRASRGDNYWWGGTIVDVCQRPYQFSCWNSSDPNRVKLLRVTDDDPAFQTCSDIAALAVSGKLVDATSGATHYHVYSIEPSWAKGKTPCCRIGNHLFYNNIE